MRLADDFLRRSRLDDPGRHLINLFVRRAAAALPPGSRVLDAGAGECAYRELFAACRYVAVDAGVGSGAWHYGNLDAIAALERLPFASAAFEAVLCTQVLEHVELPGEVVAELGRVLAPSGRLLLTAPMAQGEHQAPHDYFRYTSFGLRSLLTRAGFREIAIAPLGGMFTRLAYELPRILWVVPGSGLRRGRVTLRGLVLLPVRAILFPLVRILQALLLLADRLDVVRDHPLGWSVVAKR
ncbi:MAG: class I SAM-dependent methyltransferase [Acidobacteriota bacterium]